MPSAGFSEGSQVASALTYLGSAAGGFRSASGEIAPPPHYQFIVAGVGEADFDRWQNFFRLHFSPRSPVDVDEAAGKEIRASTQFSHSVELMAIRKYCIPW